MNISNIRNANKLCDQVRADSSAASPPPSTAYSEGSSLLGTESKVTSLDDIHKWMPILLSPFIKGLRRRRSSS